MILGRFAVLLSLLLVVPFACAASFTYDANGNLLQDDVHYYVYDDFNRLSAVRLGGSQGSLVEEYVYDSSGDRLLKVVYASNGSVVRTFYPDVDYDVVSSSGSVDRVVHFRVGGVLLGSNSSVDGLRFFHPNHLGSTDVVSDENGVVVDRVSYLPFGAELSSDADLRYKFTGKERDGTGLDYFEARYYDSGFRLFVQPDSILPDVFDPQQLNRYVYVRNNPVKFVDPSGHAAFLAPLVYYGGIAVSAAVASVGGVAAQVWAQYSAAVAAQDVQAAFDDTSASTVTAAALGVGDAVSGGGKVKAAKTSANVAKGASRAYNKLEDTKWLKGMAKQLKESREVTVQNRDEALAVLKDQFPGATELSKISGAPSKGPGMPKNSYRIDDMIDSKTGRIVGHEQSPHGVSPHINIRDSGGDKYTIKYDD